MEKPRILISSNRSPDNYIQAVEQAGGVACGGYLPEVSTDYDGLLLCGGSDIDPQYYNEPIAGSVGINQARDEVEFALLKAFVDAGKPVLGICRGHQIINVFFGGSLDQDIATASAHTSRGNGDLVHIGMAAEDSILAKLYGREFATNSAHHQAVKRLGEGLRITMVSKEDGIVEAVEHETLPVLAVQWHPERMCFANRRSDTVDGAALFGRFLELCKK